MQQLHEHGASLDHYNTRALYLQVRDRMMERIAKGIWKPGDMLPNGHDLAREMGVANATARRALELMEEEGFIVRKQGKGTMVVDKEAGDRNRRHACTQASLFIIKRASDEVGHSTTPELATALQEKISQALFDAGYSGEANGQ